MQQEKTFTNLTHQRGSTMQVKVRNLGVIHETAEIDLKPLTIFIGPNNTGKTWLAHTLAALFSEYGYNRYVQLETPDKLAQAYPPLRAVIDQVFENGTAVLDLIQFGKDYGERYFNNLARGAWEWLADFLDTQFITFDQLELFVALKEGEETFLENILYHQLQLDIGLSQKGTSIFSGRRSPLLSVRKQSGKGQLHLYTLSEEPLARELPRESIETQLIRSILHILHQSLYPHVIILAGEKHPGPGTFFRKSLRSASSPIAKKAIREHFMPYMQHMRRTRKSGRWSSGLAHYDLKPQEKRERERLGESVQEVSEYMRLAGVLEEKILGGRVSFLPLNAAMEQAKEVVFWPASTNHPLEISLASSLVKELSPLVFYLRHFALPGELFILDEPETGLHPQAQVQLIELLAMLVNAGLRVLLTTHSPYMLDHLTNLTLAAVKEDKESIRSEFFLQDARAFIGKDEVSVYLIDHGKSMDVINDEEQDKDTFGDVSNRISEIYFKL